MAPGLLGLGEQPPRALHVHVGRAAEEVTQPEPATLLGRLVAAQRTDPTTAPGAVPFGYLAGLLRAFEQDAACRHAQPNQQIAEELVVALSTVKKHANHILDKLGAANRTQATAHARDLGLLP